MPDHPSSIRSTWHDHAARSRQPPCRLPGGRDRCPAGPRRRCRPGRGPSNPSAGRVRPAEDTRHEQHLQGDPGGRGGDCRGRCRDQPSASKRRRRGRTKLGISVSKCIDRPECFRFACSLSEFPGSATMWLQAPTCGQREGRRRPMSPLRSLQGGRAGLGSPTRTAAVLVRSRSATGSSPTSTRIRVSGRSPCSAQPLARPSTTWRPRWRPRRVATPRRRRTSCWAATPQSGSNCRSRRTSIRPPATKGSSGPGWHLVKTPPL